MRFSHTMVFVQILEYLIMYTEIYNCLKYWVYIVQNTLDLLELFITLARRILFIIFPVCVLFSKASYLLFLSLFSYTLLVGFSEHTDWRVLLVYSWVFTLMLDQIREVTINKFKTNLSIYFIFIF